MPSTIDCEVRALPEFIISGAIPKSTIASSYLRYAALPKRLVLRPEA